MFAQVETIRPSRVSSENLSQCHKLSQPDETARSVPQRVVLAVRVHRHGERRAGMTQPEGNLDVYNSTTFMEYGDDIPPRELHGTIFHDQTGTRFVNIAPDTACSSASTQMTKRDEHISLGGASVVPGDTSCCPTRSRECKPPYRSGRRQRADPRCGSPRPIRPAGSACRSWFGCST